MKAVGFDLVGTLCRPQAREEECVRELCLELGRSGVDVSHEMFVEAYDRVALKYLEIRRTTHREVNNRVWIAETLRTLGLELDEDHEISWRSADAYFRPYVEKMEVPVYVAPTLSELRKRFKLGLVTNFTHASAVHDILQRNNLAQLFDSIAISDEVGWRKPHVNIFKKFLDDVSLKPYEAFFVGDDPTYDVVGAKNIGMRAILLQSEETNFAESYYKRLGIHDPKPDVILKSLRDVRNYLSSATST